VLRGASVALALPFLESVAPRTLRAQSTAAKRFIPIYMPGGASDFWAVSTGSGADFQMASLLAPFEALREKLLLVKNLGNYTWRRDLLDLSDPPWYEYISRDDLGTQMPKAAYILPSHSRQASAYMACTDGDRVRDDLGLPPTTDPTNSVTADQVIAETLGLYSMQIGLINGTGAFDGRHSAMSQNMSWSSAGTALGKDVEPANVFDKIIQAGAGSQPMDPAEAERRRALDLSALDALSQSAESLKLRLNPGDQARLDQYLTGVRDLETRVADITQQSAGASCDPQAPPTVTAPLERAQAMNDLIVTALECDVSRVISYMLDNSRSDLTYDWVERRDFEAGGVVPSGTAGSYHASQHGGLHNTDFASICHWMINVVADLATKMDAVPDGEGTLLDNSLIMFSSDMHHGDHAAWDLPMALLGSGGGTFRQGEHIVLTEDVADARQMRDFLFTIMNGYFDLGVTAFGEDARGVPNALIEEILA
jgi:hypothetical protein